MPKDESSSQDTEVKLLPAPMKSSYAFQFPDVNKNRYKDAEPRRQTAAWREKTKNKKVCQHAFDKRQSEENTLWQQGLSFNI